MEYVGVAGGVAGQGQNTGDFDLRAWAPYIGGGLVVLFLVFVVFFRARK